MDAKYKRGNIHYIASNIDKPPIGCEIWSDRPALIVSNDTNNERNGVVEVVYLTTSFHKRVSPMHIRVRSGNRYAIAMCEQIHTVDHSRIHGFIGTITEDEQADIDRALAMSLGMEQESYRGLFSKWENYIRRYGLAVVAEQEKLREQSTDKAIATLRRQISLLEKERDGWRAIAESRGARLGEAGQKMTLTEERKLIADENTDPGE